MLRIRLIRLFAILVLLLAKNLFIIALFLSSSTIQSYLTRLSIDYFAEKYNIELSIDNVYIKLPNKVSFKNVYVEDELGDTLFFTSELYVKLNQIKYFENNIHIDIINFVNPYINLKTDTLGTKNYTFLLNEFTVDKPKTEDQSFNFSIYCNNFCLKNARINYLNDAIEPVDSLFDLSSLSVKNLNFNVHDFAYCPDTISMQIYNLNFLERSGLSLHKFTSNIMFYDEGLELTDFIVSSNESYIDFTKLILSGEDEDYLSDPLNKLNLELIVGNSKVAFSDLTYFLPQYKGIKEKVYFSGRFNGNISRLRLNDFKFAYSDDTQLEANISIDGLPDFNNAFIFGNVSSLSTTGEDLTKIISLFSPETALEMPPIIDDINYINFTGNITGLFNDAVAYGRFVTNLGTISTDMSLAMDIDKSAFRYRGSLSADNLHLGIILGDEKNFGRLTMNARLDGMIDSLQNFSTNINATINRLWANEYNYSNIKIDAALANNYFEGEITVDDENLSLELEGIYDSRGKYPNISLATRINANLNEINLVADTIPSSVNMFTDVKLTGDIMSMPEGSIIINDFCYRQNQDSIIMNNFMLMSFYDSNDKQNLSLLSDFVDVDIRGMYDFSELIEKLSVLFYNYFPSIAEDDYEEFVTDNLLDFRINLKNLEDITTIFLPELITETNITIDGKLNTLNNAISAELQTSYLQYDSIVFTGNNIKVQTYHDSIDIALKFDKIESEDFVLFENLNFNVNVFKDSIYSKLNWDNFDTINYSSGEISFSALFIPREEYAFPIINTRLYESSFITQNREWHISETPIKIDTSDIEITNFKLTHLNQSLHINGVISKDPTKTLRYLVTNVDVSNVNNYIEDSGYSFYGILNGSGRVAGLYDVPSFRTSFSIADFKVNENDFGRFDLSGNYNAETGAFYVDGRNRFMQLRGNYVPETDSVSLGLNVENFSIDLLEPYLINHGLSELSGNINIHVNVDGELRNPNVDGYLIFDQTELVYDLLKARVFTNDKVKIKSTGIVMDNFKIIDEYGNEGRINGGLTHSSFKDIKFDFLINTNNMKVLNTSAIDNDMYYGTGFATASVRISGTPQQYGIDVDARTESNTVFVLPMTQTYSERDVGFISFVNPKIDQESVDLLEPVQSKSNYYFRMDLEVTPDAETQIVFDPRSGDLIRGFGRGNIKLEYTSDREFYMYGELEVIEGDYLFTLQNVINKRFHVQPGGTIIWNGDPYEANVDLDAVYRLRAPLIDLMRAYADTSDVYRRPTNVECHMNLKGNLMSPDIKFGIEVPNADEKAQTQVASLSQDDINMQILYLLVLSRFYTPTDVRAEAGANTNAFGLTSSELLSNQLSNWLSQISRDFDIGFNYRPGTELTGQEVELALSTQILNDRVLINGNVGYGEDIRTATNTVVGDVEVQLKVNPRGSFRIKGFTRANDDIVTSELGPYTSGMGVFYTEDFNSFGELARKIYNAVTFKRLREQDD